MDLYRINSIASSFRQMHASYYYWSTFDDYIQNRPTLQFPYLIDSSICSYIKSYHIFLYLPFTSASLVLVLNMLPRCHSSTPHTLIISVMKRITYERIHYLCSFKTDDDDDDDDDIDLISSSYPNHRLRNQVTFYRIIVT